MFPGFGTQFANQLAKFDLRDYVVTQVDKPRTTPVQRAAPALG